VPIAASEIFIDVESARVLSAAIAVAMGSAYGGGGDEELHRVSFLDNGRGFT
jgi:hypothetical protein